MTPSPFAALLGFIVLSASPAVARSPQAPRVDYHQHLVSPAFAEIVKLPVLDGAELGRRLDVAGVEHAVVLSMAYTMADERKGLSDPDRRSRDENNWTSAQVAASRGRLIGFCSANPLRDAALDELRRCLALPGMKGVKLHFGNSGVSLRDPAQAERMATVFRLIGAAKVPVLVHMRARGGENFGARDAELFIDTLLPLVPASDVIVAHFAGAGPGYPAQADELMAVFAAAAERRDTRLKRTYFDMSTILTKDSSPADTALVARRIRQIGPRHVLYGSDLLSPTAPTIADQWGYLAGIGLTDSELRTIAGNRLGFVR